MKILEIKDTFDKQDAVGTSLMEEDCLKIEGLPKLEIDRPNCTPLSYVRRSQYLDCIDWMQLVDDSFYCDCGYGLGTALSAELEKLYQDYTKKEEEK